MLRWFREQWQLFPMTMVMCGIYVGLFAAMAITQGRLDAGGSFLTLLGLNIDTLVAFGAIDDERVIEQHEYWRLITATLLHGSLVHLFFNTLALYQLGRVIEHWYSSSAVVLLHVLLGLSGSITSLWVHRMMPGRIIQVGGSGAIFGFLGFLLLALFFDPRPVASRIFRSLAITMMIAFALGSLMGADDAAHVGGAFGGALIGIFDRYLHRQYLSRTMQRRLAGASFAVIIGAFLCCGWNQWSAEKPAPNQPPANVADERVDRILRLRASLQLLSIRSYVAGALRMDHPPPLRGRAEHARVLLQLADGMRDPNSANYLRKIASLLTVESDEEFTSRRHLTILWSLLPSDERARRLSVPTPPDEQ